ncbi:unnamed protein product [Somion occarium]|uniref:Uncharacterized protein n=1 Tax=Somion occarium TaxID=3059160 RepID=A0ABP1DMG3_9APHY
MFSVKLGNNGKLLGSIGGKILTALVGQQISRRHWGLAQAGEERRRVMYNQAREEVHQRFYANMDPSHRLAFEYFRQTGIVFPFGGSIAEFTEPNYSFFMPGCQTPEWLQHDQVQPLDSWDRPTVVEVGRAHGCHESDIFGCLYFYLSEELRAFAERLRRFKISIYITSQTTKDLAPKIKEGAFESLGLQPTVQFDRIDFHICVLENRLTTPTELILNWGPLLKRENPHATMLGALMVWADNEPNGKLYDVSEISVANGPSADDFIRGVETTAVVAEFWRKGWIPMPVSGALNTPAIFSHVHVLHAVYDNSKAFAMYLERNDIPAIAKRAGLKLKTKHTVVPHRPIGVPLDAPFNAVPEFASREDFYLQVQLTSGITEFTERYIEFGPA